MSLKSLIENQSIKIDDHKWGNREIKDWDNKQFEVHIDKTTFYPINGKKQNIKIKIPINSNNEVVIKNKKRHIEIPIQLKKEIRKAFENKFIRDKFINDLIIILKNYKTILTDEERVNDVLKILSHYFELNLIEKNVITFSNNKIISITNFYKDDNDVFYFITINEKSIRIGQLNKFFKHQIGSKILK